MDWNSTKEQLPSPEITVCVKYRGIEFKASHLPGTLSFQLLSGQIVTFEFEEMFWIPENKCKECDPSFPSGDSWGKNCC